MTASGGMRWTGAAGFAAAYEALNVAAIFDGFAADLTQVAGPRDGERALDVCAGTGIVLRHLRAACPALGRLVGLDLNRDMLAVAERAAAPARAELVAGDAAALPFEGAAFDLVTCQQGVQFFPDRPAALAEMRRVLAPGGRTVVAVWGDLATTAGHRAFAEAAETVAPPVAAAARNPHVLGDGAALGALLEGAGFADVAVRSLTREVSFPSAEHFVRTYAEGSPVALVLGGLGPAVQDAVRAAALERVRPLAGPDGTVAFAMTTNVATGRA